MKKTPKNAEKFSCEKCDFKCIKESDWNRHIATAKHINRINGIEKTPKTPNIPKAHICNCGKEYKYSRGLWTHKKTCDYKLEETKKEEKVEEEKVEKVEQVDKLDYKDMFLTMMKENRELQNTIINQQQEYQKTIKEMIPKIGNNNTTNTTTTNNNNQFNLQMFLNEDCKNALNIKDFVNSLQLSIKDLTDTGKLGYVNGISRIFVNALNDMDITERPIHCTDLKRETVYIKDADKWEKEGSENTKLKKTIRDIENKNIRMIPKWQEENPECRIMDTRQADELMEISINALGGNEEKEKSAKKIVKNVLKEVTIDKNV